jgi:oligoendopeptidase F
MQITRPERKFISNELNIQKWEDLEPYFKILLNQKINSIEDFKNWLLKKSELDAVLEEDVAWRYIKMTIDTKNESHAAKYQFFVTEIQPKLAPLDDQLNRKMIDFKEYIEELSKNKDYFIYFRSVKKAIELFKEENIVLESEISQLAQEYGSISGAQSINYKGEDITLQKAATYLKDQNETVRKDVFDLIADRRKVDVEKLDILFDQLIQKRHQVAINAGYKNFRDYKFDDLGRFDYTKEDCFAFHQSIKTHIVPLVKLINEEQAKKLRKQKLKPWDTEVDPDGKEALKPFLDGKELTKKTVSMLERIDEYFADCIQTMNEMKHLDLDSKNGKAPGGYNYPLYEIGVPFIFMNAVGSQRDLTTMVHEGGHAIHSFLSRNLKLTSFKSLPSEVAELASMSMELLSMDYWDEFYTNSDDLKRAKLEQIESVIKVLPWIAIIDEFQHWIYANPNHSKEERKNQWNEINKSYGTGVVDWEGYEDIKAYSWQRQLHLYEVPFYYIEYGIAQLGAISIWKNSKIDFKNTINSYKKALSLGYTKTIPEIYEEAGIKFDFSDNYLLNIANFVQSEINILKN